MKTQKIRKMIAEASQIEKQTGILLKHFTDSARLHNIQVTEQGFNDLVRLVRKWQIAIRKSRQAISDMRLTGWWNVISPILEAAQQPSLVTRDPSDERRATSDPAISVLVIVQKRALKKHKIIKIWYYLQFVAHILLSTILQKNF